MTFGLSNNPDQFLHGVGWSGAAADAEGAATATSAHFLACWQIGNHLSIVLSGMPSSYQLGAIGRAVTAAGLAQGTYTTFEVLSGVTPESGFTTTGEGGAIELAPAPPSADVVHFSKVITPALAARGLRRTIVMTLGSGRLRMLAVIALGAENTTSSDTAVFLASALATAMSVPPSAISVEAFKAL